MDSEELLAQLADIHLPEPVGFWPPAPGWWILAVLLLIAAAIGARLAWLAHQRRQIRQHALAELNHCYQAYSTAESEPEQARLDYINGVNSVLRRVALVHFPGTGVGSLGGREWVDFIRQNGDSSRLDDDLANALSHGRFQSRCEVDVDALDAMARAWLSSLYQRRPTSSGRQGLST